MSDDNVSDAPHSEEVSHEEEDADKLQAEERGPPLGCIFVANIANETTEEAVRNVFVQYGEIMKMRLLKDRSARPYAFIQYKSVESATQALLHGGKQTIDGKRLRIERAKVNRTLFVAKIDRNLTGAQLREMMEPYGPVENVTVIKNHVTNKSKGCGFVKFIYREDAMDAFTALKNDQRLHWVVEWATSTSDPAGGDSMIDRCNLFVGGLSPASITKELLEEKFKEYGTLENVTLINREMENAGSVSSSMAKSAYAFLRYSDPQSALKAMERENGTEWLDKRKIRVQYCESQEMKNRRKAAKFVPPAIQSQPDHMPMIMDDFMLNWHLNNMGMGMSYLPPQDLRKGKDLMSAGGGYPYMGAGQYPMMNPGLLHSFAPPVAPSRQWLGYPPQPLQQHQHMPPQQSLGYPDQDAGSMLSNHFNSLNLGGQQNAPPSYNVW